MVADSAMHCVTQFVDDVKEDLRNPTTSTFSTRVPLYRQYSNCFSENIDFDLDGLQKLKKSVKLLYEAGHEWHRCEQELVLALDQIAGLNATNSLLQDVEPEISAAWLKFCVIFKDLSVLTRSLVQSVKNNLVFPVENLLKSPDLKDKYEFKKNLDKAFKDYDAKLSKCEKQHKSSSVAGHLLMSNVDLAESLICERTVLQYELCKFFLQAGKIRGKKGTELLQHLIDFYHTQESFYREGLKTVEEFRTYVAQLIDKLNDVKRKQDDERKHLRDLAETLEKSPLLRDYERSERISEMVSSSTEVPPAVVYSTEPSTSCGGPNAGSSMVGYLLKQSAHKVHKSWLRRKCQVRNGTFYMWHNDESLPPVKMNLLTCQIKSDKNDKKCFDIVSYERTYHFQAEDEQHASNWLYTLVKNRDTSQNEVFHQDDSSTTAGGGGNAADGGNSQKIAAVIERIKTLPENDKCCDCDSQKDVTWTSVNLGSLHCIDCSGVHRELGVQVSRIQSLNLDYADMATLLLPLSIGNKIVNEVYEANKIDLTNKANFTVRNNVRKNFIISKYVDKKFVDKHLKSDDAQRLFAESVHNACMKNLLRAFAAGVDLNMIFDEDNFENALFLAVRLDDCGSHLAYIQFLVQNGIDANRVNLSGDTALHLAVRLDKPDCVKLILLSRNLRFSLANASEETPQQLARRLERTACEILISKIERNDRSGLGDISLHMSLIPVASRSSMGKSDNESPLVSADSSPRFGSAIVGNSKLRDSIRQHVIENALLSSSVNRHAITTTTTPDNVTSAKSNNETSSAPVSSPESVATSTTTLKKHLPGAKLVLPPPVSAPQTHSGATSAASRDQSTAIDGDHVMVKQQLRKKLTANTSPSNSEPKENASGSVSPAPKPLPRQRLNSKPIVKRCRALYDCSADLPDELTFTKGDVIIVTKDRMHEEEDNWLEGYVETKPDRIGLFPVTFVTFEK